MAEMLGQPGLPCRIHVIACLQNGPGLARSPAMYQSGMATVGAREQLHNRRGLTVRFHTQYDGFVRPFHGRCLSLT
jgi:hypothetical protein